MRTLTIICAVAALSSCGPAKQDHSSNAAGPEATEAQTKGVDRSHKGEPAPDTAFNDPDGEETTLADFQGRPLLVNLWASWCAPCVKELPTLDALAGDRSGNGPLQVLAVSQDIGSHGSVVAFLQSHRIARLDAYQDPKMALSGALNAQVLPVSILFDARGQEVWRYVGDLDWTSPAAAKLLAEGGASPAG
jgi:thiol-disulfide isomerase/thioredoxin